MEVSRALRSIEFGCAVNKFSARWVAESAKPWLLSAYYPQLRADAYVTLGAVRLVFTFAILSKNAETEVKTGTLIDNSLVQAGDAVVKMRGVHSFHVTGAKERQQMQLLCSEAAARLFYVEDGVR